MKFVKSVVSLMLATTFIGAAAACKDNNDKDGPGGNVQTPAVLETIKLSSASVELGVGDTHTLRVTTELTGEKKWVSSDTNVVTVDENGVITAVEEGEARVYLTIGDDRAECKVTVKTSLENAPRLDLDTKTLNLLAGYNEYQIKASLRNGAQKTALSGDAVTWTVSDDAVIGVTNGTISAKKTGTATITASYIHEGKTLTASVSVLVDTVNMFALNDPTQVLGTTKTYAGEDTRTGSSYTLSAFEIVGEGAGIQMQTVANTEITWESSNPDIISVEGGELRASALPGKATITAKYGTKTDTIEVESYVAMQSKKDFDTLALASAIVGRDGGEVTEADVSAWSANAKYVLTEDIDYAGGYWIPIAENSLPYQAAGGLFVGTTMKTSVLAGGVSYNGLTAENYTELNKGKLFFNGTVDGNKNVIKNAKILSDGYLARVNATDTNMPLQGNIIGLFGTSGLLSNIAWDNLSLESREVYAATNYKYQAGTDEYTVSAGAMRGGGIIFLCMGSLKNVYIKIDMSGKYSAGWQATGINYFGNNSWYQGSSAVAQNVVLNVTLPDDAKSAGPIQAVKDGVLDNFYVIGNSTKAIAGAYTPSAPTYATSEAFKAAEGDNNLLDWTLLNKVM